MTRVLVAEDQALVASLLEGAVIGAGYSVLGPVGTVAKAMEIIATEAISAAVLDVNLPDGNSGPVADALADRRIPFLFVTGNPSGISKRHASAPVVIKPFAIAEVQAVIKQLLLSNFNKQA